MTLTTTQCRDVSSFSIEPGLTAVVGLSGGGKSTLLDALGQALTSVSTIKGTVEFADHTRTSWCEFARSRNYSAVRLVPQAEIMYPDLTVSSSAVAMCLLILTYTDTGVPNTRVRRSPRRCA